jgi:outer membrane lipoprotein SlyB
MAKTLLLTAFVLVLAGYVNQSTWTPTVNTYGTSNEWRRSQDEAQCRQLAMQAAGNSVEKTAEGVGIGGALAAAAGAAAGNPGRGAAVGAAAGGFAGGDYEGFETNAAFKSDFDQCLRQRGYQVIG